MDVLPVYVKKILDVLLSLASDCNFSGSGCVITETHSVCCSK